MTAEVQAVQLLCSFGLGTGLGVFYDIYRVWFRAPGKKWLKGMGDMLWWALALAAAAGALYHINGLELRLVPLMLAAAGCIIEQALLSPRLFPAIDGLCRFVLRCCRAVGRFLRRVIEFLLYPLVWPVELAFRLLLFIRKLAVGVLKKLRDLALWLLRPLLRPFMRQYRRFKGGIKRRLKARLLAEEAREAESGAEE